MYLRSAVVLLIAVLVNAESNIVLNGTYAACDGGYCMPKHLCPTGRINDVSNLGPNRLVTVRIGEENECGDFMKICCKNPEQINYKCGVSNPQGMVYDVESELTYAKYAEFPWTVVIFQKASSGNNPMLAHVGGGSLIHPKFVVTTAHTLKDSQRYVARFGEWDMESDGEIYPTQDIEIWETIKHPHFRDVSPPENDVALAVLKENVIYSEHIRPLCIPSAQDNFDGQRCIASGWGLDVRTGQPPAMMKRMELNVLSHTRCLTSFYLFGLIVMLHDSNKCVSAVQDQNYCFRDGGTSLACQRADGSYVLAGLPSWVLYCNIPAVPAGILDVTKFAHWINETIEEYEEPKSKL
uniref:Peptidase S1 domain-containing protein n=1 Tax=Anopheles minimus TaxID=112268 RepID=A0A1Y9IW32_9DIPT